MTRLSVLTAIITALAVFPALSASAASFSESCLETKPCCRSTPPRTLEFCQEVLDVRMKWIRCGRVHDHFLDVVAQPSL